MKALTTDFAKHFGFKKNDFKKKYQPGIPLHLLNLSNKTSACDEPSSGKKLIFKVKKFGKSLLFSLKKVRKTNENFNGETNNLKTNKDASIKLVYLKKNLPIFCNEKEFQNYLNNVTCNIKLKKFEKESYSSLSQKLTAGLKSLNNGKANQSINIFKDLKAINEVLTHNQNVLDKLNKMTVDKLLKLLPSLDVDSSELNKIHKRNIALDKKEDVITKRLEFLKDQNKNLQKLHDKVLSQFSDYHYAIADQKSFAMERIKEVIQHYDIQYYSDTDLLKAVETIYYRYFSDPMTLFNMDKKLWHGYIYDLAEKELKDQCITNDYVDVDCGYNQPVPLRAEILAMLSDDAKQHYSTAVDIDDLDDKKQNTIAKIDAESKGKGSDFAQENQVEKVFNASTNNNAGISQPSTISSTKKAESMETLKITDGNSLLLQWEKIYQKVTKKDVIEKTQAFENMLKKFFEGEKIDYIDLHIAVKNFRLLIHRQLIDLDKFITSVKYTGPTELGFLTINKNIPSLKDAIDNLHQQRLFFEEANRDLYDIRNKLRENFKRGITHF